jgi:nucleoside-triphosphatase
VNVKADATRILITGNPGSGKSTLMARLIEDVHARRLAGLSTPELRRAGTRVGFKIIDLTTGEEELLASTSGKGPAVGKYHVNLAAIEKTVRRVEASLDASDFIFLDEIGKMELLSKSFEELVERVFSLAQPVIAVVHRNFVSRYKNKGRLFVLKRDNFEEVRNSILGELKRSRRE